MTLLNSLKIEDSSISTVITSGVQLSVSSTSATSHTSGGHIGGCSSSNGGGLSNAGDKENNNPAGSKKKSRTRPGKDKKYDKKNKMKTEASALDLVCVYCNLSFADKVEFQVSLHNHDFNFWN